MELFNMINYRADCKARNKAQTELFEMASRAYERKWTAPQQKPKQLKRDYTPINCLLAGLIFLEIALMF